MPLAVNGLGQLSGSFDGEQRPLRYADSKHHGGLGGAPSSSA
jgi:hypothetical protein